MESFVFQSSEEDAFLKRVEEQSEKGQDFYVVPSEITMTEKGSILRADGDILLETTPDFEEHLCHSFGIPLDYYRKMPQELRAKNVNYWLSGENGRRLIRTTTFRSARIARAYLHEDYPIVDNSSIASSVLEYAAMFDMEVRFHSAFISDRMMSMNLLGSSRTYSIGPGEKKEEVHFGLNARNSEIGFRPFSMGYFILFPDANVCMTYGDMEIMKRWTGNRKDPKGVESLTRRFEGKVIFLPNVKEASEYILNVDNVGIMADRMMEAGNQMIFESTRIIEAFISVLKLREQEAQNAWDVPKEPTRLELAKAVSLSSAVGREGGQNEVNDGWYWERKIALEESAGELLFRDDIWNSFVEGSRE